MPDTMNRFEGARSTFGMKKPVRAATTANITLNGFQTVDGVAFADGDEANGRNMRCLVKNQTNAYENAVYQVSSSDWERAKDFDGNTDFVKGTLIEVTDGTVNGGRFYTVDSVDPPHVGTDSITFRRLSLDQFSKNATITAAATIDLNDADGGLGDGDAVLIVGTTSITAIALGEGKSRLVQFDDVLTITGSDTLVLPGGNKGFTSGNGQPITAARGDFALFRGYAEGVVRCVFYMRKHGHPLIVSEATIASATTTSLGGSISVPIYDQCILISGTTPITSFGDNTNLPTGTLKFVRFAGILTLTHGASLILPGAQNIITAANDCAIFKLEASSVWRCVAYVRANSHPLITGLATIASATTTDLGSVREQAITISGTTPITSFGSSAPTGAVKFVEFSGSLTLTHNGTSLILPNAASVIVFAGDCLTARHEGSGNWRVLSFSRALPSGVVSVDTADTSTIANTTETDLKTYSLPAGRLGTNGNAVKVTAWGTTAANGNNKRLRLYFGATAIADTAAIALNGASWRLEGIIVRTGATAQKATSLRSSSDATTLPTASAGTAPAETLANAITIKVTGLNGTASAGDITASGMIVELMAA